MRLNDSETAEAEAVLAAAGIVGSDARSSLRVLTAVAAEADFAAWRAAVRGVPKSDLFARYGADAGRAAVVLAQ